MRLLFEGLFHPVEELLIGMLVVGMVSLFGGWALAIGLRMRALRWSWSGVLLAPALLVGGVSLPVSVGAVGVCVVATLVGMAWHATDVMAGGDRARAAEERLGVLGAIGLLVDHWQQAHAGASPGMSTGTSAGVSMGAGANMGASTAAGWVSEGRLTVGRDRWGRRVWIPAGERAGSHTLIVGATRSGKTCSEAWIAARLIERGHGAVVVDPKGDGLLRGELHDAARRMGVAFLEWSPHGPLAYNPYAHGDDDEVVEKALAGEMFTEPHYLRQAQRYLGQAVRAMRGAQVPVTPASLAAHMDPLQLEATVRALPPERALDAQEYLESLSERQRRELAGVRDRLAILTESDFAQWLEPERAGGEIDLRKAVAERAVVYFALESDRRPLLAQMLACAVVTDLIALAGERHHDPVPTVAVIDEFSAVAAQHIWRLFARAASAGVSLVLATQELADLQAVGQGALRDQIGGNLQALIAYRQNMPASAELIAQIAGTRTVWERTQYASGIPLPLGPFARRMRRRGHEHEIHPTQIQRLGTGQAAVITPGSQQAPTIAHMRHPSEARPNQRHGGAM